MRLHHRIIGESRVTVLPHLQTSRGGVALPVSQRRGSHCLMRARDRHHPRFSQSISRDDLKALAGYLPLQNQVVIYAVDLGTLDRQLISRGVQHRCP